MTLKNPQQEAADKALVELLKKDPPGTKYLINPQTIWMQGNKVKILIAHVLSDNP